MQPEDSDIIVCAQCGTKNRPREREASQALVCGNCKAPLLQKEAEAHAPQPAPDEVVYYKNDPWLVTDKRVCTSRVTIRTSNICSVEIVEKKGIAGVVVGWIAVVLITGGIFASLRYEMPHHLPENLWDIIFFSIPGLVAAWLWNTWSKERAILVVHAKTGPIELGEAILYTGFRLRKWRRFSESPEDFRKCVERLKLIKEAISKTLATSPVASGKG